MTKWKKTNRGAEERPHRRYEELLEDAKFAFESTQACFKVLPNAPQQLKDLIGVETIEVVTDDVVR